MQKCIHEEVCQHKVEREDGSCVADKVCKYCEGVEPVRVHDRTVMRAKKRKYTRKIKAVNPDDDNIDAASGPTKEEFLKARAKISHARQCKSLNENQLLALNSPDMKAKSYRQLSVAQREQIINIAKDL